MDEGMVNDPAVVLDFWRAAGPKKWWTKDDDFDASIASHFGGTYELAGQGGYDDWADRPDAALALIIMLDQFSRNLHRNSPLAFSRDEKCLNIVKKVMAAGLDRQMPEDLVTFCYLPLMHSEDVDDQKICLEQMQRLGEEGSIKASLEHLDIIERFGRFPHRNAVLGRESTLAEKAFLDGGGFSG